ncbi:MAG TPA: serine/threonine-protein kinase [Ktedonobacteraceae bacterium]|nr:serine/threonine-protein kinase [Ktedonobacteraceae bacterium]
MSTAPHYLGKYVLQERLAYGGMGEVWKSFDPQLQRHVAIKLLRTDRRHDPDFVTRFEREARFIASLHHPNIVQIHDFRISQPPESNPAQAYMVMDYVQGQTLADYIQNTSRQGQFPSASDIIYLFTAISLAIDYAHQKGMIHRDIKPANILLDQRLPTAKPMGEPVLTDFGIAQIQETAPGGVIETLLGTPHYIAPEQAQGEPGDNRSDLYSLGIILYEMMTGVTPFRGNTAIAILMQHIQGVLVPPESINVQLPAQVSKVILKSIARKPADRFSTAAEMTIALAEAFNIPVPQVLSETKYSIATPTASPLSVSAPLSLASQELQPSVQREAMFAVQPGKNADPITPSDDILKAPPIPPIPLQIEAHQDAYPEPQDPLEIIAHPPITYAQPLQQFTMPPLPGMIVITLLILFLLWIIFYVSQYAPLLSH